MLPLTIDPAVARVSALDIRVAAAHWAFADARREDINAHFAKLRRLRPALWNGRVLMLRSHRIERDVFCGEAFVTDFASFIAWRDWGFPDLTVRNFFGMGALRGRDGGFLLGVMGAHTANAGLAYFPSGTPEPQDAPNGAVDLEGNVMRELAEETGIMADEVEPGRDWTLVFAGPRIAIMKTLTAREPVATLRERVLSHLAREAAPELDDMRIVRGPADLDAQTPPFVGAFLRLVWGSEVRRQRSDTSAQGTDVGNQSSDN